MIRPTNQWDEYYLSICYAIGRHSKCLSRQLGAILVRDKSIISTGYNGPARGVKHCHEECPRKVAGYKSGEGLQFCLATHAEANCIANAARHGTPTKGSTLYLNWVHPCKDCTSLLINAGIVEIVCMNGIYDDLSQQIAGQAGIVIRSYNV